MGYMDNKTTMMGLMLEVELEAVMDKAVECVSCDQAPGGIGWRMMCKYAAPRRWAGMTD